MSARRPAIVTDIYGAELKQTTKMSGSLSGVLAGIRTGYLQTTSIERSPYLHQLSYPLYLEAVSHPQSVDASCRQVSDPQNISVCYRPTHWRNLAINNG
jgi:hypothetical protein